MPADDPQGHHYVPQFLLGNFAFHVGRKGKGSNRVWVFDKQERRHFPSPVKDIAKQRLFYEIELGGLALTLEPELGDLESRTGSIIADVLAQRSVAKLSEENRWRLAYFCAVQQLRGPQNRHARKSASELMARVAQRFGAPAHVAARQIKDDKRVKAEALNALVQSAHRDARLYLAKVWFLTEAPTPHPYWISDNPIALDNNMPKDPFVGSIGLAVPGIEIYLPLSKKITLAMWCPTLVEEVRSVVQGMQKVDQLRSKGALDPAARAKHDSLKQGGANMAAVLHAATTGGVLTHDESRVVHLNALQAFNGYRYIYASADDFSLAERVLDAHPDHTKGPVLVPVKPFELDD